MALIRALQGASGGGSIDYSHFFDNAVAKVQSNYAISYTFVVGKEYLIVYSRAGNSDLGVTSGATVLSDFNDTQNYSAFIKATAATINLKGVNNKVTVVPLE